MVHTSTKNLKPLIHIPESDLLDDKTHVEPEFVIYKSRTHKSGNSKYPLAWSGKIKYTKMPLAWKEGPNPDRWKHRSKTFTGIAKAMAEQWG